MVEKNNSFPLVVAGVKPQLHVTFQEVVVEGGTVTLRCCRLELLIEKSNSKHAQLNYKNKKSE